MAWRLRAVLSCHLSALRKFKACGPRAFRPSVCNFSSATLRLNRERLNLVPEKPRIEAVEEATSVEPDNARFTEKINRLGRDGRWTEAEGIFSHVKVKNTVLYTAIMSAALRCDRHAEGMRYFEEMLEVGIRRNEATYSCALTILGRQGSYQAALDLWEEMGRLGVGQDNEACLTALLDAAALAGDVEAVRKHIDDARSRGVQLNAAHFGCLLKACREAGDPQGAMQLLSLVPQRNIVHYTLCMGACTKAAAADRLSDDEVQVHVRDIEQCMARDAVRPDKYFLEEQVRASLRVADLKHVFDSDASRLPSLRQAEVTLETLQAFRLKGIFPTNLLRAVEQKLQERVAKEPRDQSATWSKMPGSSERLPAGWCQALDPASGQPYYWRSADPAGTTTWERPL